LDLGAQPLDVDVDRAGVGSGAVVAPYLLDQCLAVEHVRGAAGQGEEPVELPGRELDEGLSPSDAEPVHGDDPVPDVYHRRSGLLMRAVSRVLTRGSVPRP